MPARRKALRIDSEFDRRMMAAALRLGRRNLGQTHPNPAVGCVIVRTDGDEPVVVGRGWTAVGGRPHAEKQALKEAGAAAEGATAYVTLEPCTMCAAAISFARIERLYFGAYDEKAGAVENGVRFFTSPACHHAPEVYGSIAEMQASAMLKEFFAARRA